MQTSNQILIALFRSSRSEYHSMLAQIVKSYLRDLRPGLHDIGLLFVPDSFPESGTKNAPDCEWLHEAWKAAP